MTRGARRWTLKQKVAFLRDARNYPGARHAAKVKAIETHFAWVFLSGRHAYKLKKPLKQGSMDYRSLAARARGCRTELRLNRRLAKSIYLRVLPLTSARGVLKIGGRGVIQDWLVDMRRLDASRMLDQTLARRTLTRSETTCLTAMLVRFFARAPAARTGRNQYIMRLRRKVSANQRVISRAGALVSQDLLDEVVRGQRRFITCARDMLGKRGAFLIEGHGDLRAEHVHLGPPLCVIDCLEFSRDLRRLDPVDEMCFLAFEIERLGHPRLAAAMLDRYRIAMRDPVDEAAVDFYKSLRALTRARTSIWHLADPRYTDARPWTLRAHSYLRDARRYVQEALDRLECASLARVGKRPLRQQGRERPARTNTGNRLPKQWRDVQQAQLAVQPG
jgi:aminoglycoside phosphotransferase family enzyme